MQKQPFLLKIAVAALVISQVMLFTACKNHSTAAKGDNEEYDGPAQAAAFDFKRTKDPALGRVPRERLIAALNATEDSKLNGPFRVSGYGVWTERGPNSDVAGPSGNSRPNSDITAGRTRAILVDAADATGNTVFLGGVDGGLWKTTNVTSAPPTWTLVNDFFSNMAISGICQNPASTNIMYFCTGESYFSADAAAGDGIFKSTNGGTTWTQLASTTGASFDYCSRILCDASGNVYVSTRSGVFRSTDGGTNWTTITPSGLATSRFSDMELSNTGRLHVSAGQFSTCAYRYTDNPSTVTSATWTSPASGYPASSVRIELGCFGNTLYALPSDATYQVPTLYKSTDGGANWAATTGQPTGGWASQQAWYSLTCAIDPSNSNTAIVGGLDNYKTTDGGATWTKISTWVGVSGQYVHADNHVTVWYDNGNKLLFGSDGGIFYSADKGTTIRDRNTGLRIKQFYSCAINPTAGSNILLAGAQDNGSHMLNSPGLGSSTEVTGGDGAFVHIDQDEPQYMFTSYVYNQYRRSTNTGSTWTSINFSSTLGQFINPTDYDDAANIMYCAYSAGNYKRWTNPQTGNTNANINITTFGGNSLSCVTVSPYTSNRVYFGTESDVAATKLCYVDNANTIASGSAGTDISAGLPTNTYTSCLATGTNDNNLMVCYSNYGVQQIWVSTNGGTSWTNIDGNLPDMPVYWCIFSPNDNTKAIIATETGVWATQLINGGSTVWFASPSFPTVRTTMLQVRASDKLLLASSYGRGLWSQNAFSVLPVNNFTLRGKWSSSTATELKWNFEETSSGGSFTPEYSFDGQHFLSAGNVAVDSRTSYSFNHQPGRSNIFYRIKHTSNTNQVLYSNTIKLFRGSNNADLQLTKLFPNPVQSELKVAFIASGAGKMAYTITNMAGQTVWRKEENLEYTGSYIRNWSIGNFDKGNYIFTINNGKEKVSEKFVKL